MDEMAKLPLGQFTGKGGQTPEKNTFYITQVKELIKYKTPPGQEQYICIINGCKSCGIPVMFFSENFYFCFVPNKYCNIKHQPSPTPSPQKHPHKMGAARCIKSDAFVTRATHRTGPQVVDLCVVTLTEVDGTVVVCKAENEEKWLNLRGTNIATSNTSPLLPHPHKNTHIKWFVDTITNYYNISNNISVHNNTEQSIHEPLSGFPAVYINIFCGQFYCGPNGQTSLNHPTRMRKNPK
jgi:hypothetical protein